MQAVLDSDIYVADKTTISTEKIIYKIWDHRKSPEQIQFYTDILTYFVDDAKVFIYLEFFVPEIAHMAIQLFHEGNLRAAIDNVILLMCQTSIHVALQFRYIFLAGLEDFQAALNNEQINSHRNHQLFNRCARMIQDIERIVIYGGRNNNASDDHRHGILATISDCIITSSTSTEGNKNSNESEMGAPTAAAVARRISIVKTPSSYDKYWQAVMLFKRHHRVSSLKTKHWNPRHFYIRDKVLYCFKEAHSVNPKRSMSLDSCKIEPIDGHKKYGSTSFVIRNCTSNVVFHLRADNKLIRDQWISVIRKEVAGAPKLMDLDPDLSTSDVIIDRMDLTSEQRKRLAYFRQLTAFFTNMTNICEKLRFKDRSLRKYFLRKDMSEIKIPPLAYLPLCSSSDAFSSVLRALPNEGHAFSTKARCPALMFFETLTPLPAIETASFLGARVELFDESDVIKHECLELSFDESSPEWEDEDEKVDTDDRAVDHQRGVGMQLDALVNKQHMHTRGVDTQWVSSSTCFQRLEKLGFTVPVGSTAQTHTTTHTATTSSSSELCIVQALMTKVKQTMTKTEVQSTTDTKADDHDHVSDSDNSDDPITTQMESTLNGETFAQKAARLRSQSPYGHLPGWGIGGLIAKSNDDVRQEVFVMQLIRYYQRAFKTANIAAWLFTYTIMNTSQSTGLIQLIPDATSLDGLKKSKAYPGSLRRYFEQTFGYVDGQHETPAFRAAMDNYVSSMAGYSIVSYLLAIKDRHNGNIMINTRGHIVHIDFGFVFGLAPGKAFSMETAPWKLTPELVDVMGGSNSPDFQNYTKQCTEALIIARKYHKQVKGLMEIMSYKSRYPSFVYNSRAIAHFESRLMLDVPDQQIADKVKHLISSSLGNTGTSLYDQFQLATNGIAP